MIKVKLVHRLLYTWIGHEIFGTAIRVVIAVDDGCEMYLSRAENMKLERSEIH